MKDDNKNLFGQELFTKRVKDLMVNNNITIDELCQKINNAGYEITKNNLNIYIQRTPNVNFLIALSKALNAPIDYLLGQTDDYQRKGFDYSFASKRYRKYKQGFYFYFFPTVSNSPKRLEKARLYFDVESPNRVRLDIPVEGKNVKQYTGEFLLSDDYDVGYVILKGTTMGECVFLSFLDPVINRDTEVQLLAGAMLSVSSGDFKRVPVMSRFILSKHEIPEEKKQHVAANLWLNTKYVLIMEDGLQEAVKTFGLSDTQIDNIIARLTTAFTKKECYLIEESYILNTLKNDCRLSLNQAIGILDILRNNAYSQANSKLNKVIDARMYSYIFGDSDQA